MEYIVQITETLRRKIYVEADTVEEAKQKTVDNYYEGNIVLTADDCIDGSVQFEVVGQG